MVMNDRWYETGHSPHLYKIQGECWWQYGIRDGSTWAEQLTRQDLDHLAVAVSRWYRMTMAMMTNSRPCIGFSPTSISAKSHHRNSFHPKTPPNTYRHTLVPSPAQINHPVSRLNVNVVGRDFQLPFPLWDRFWYGNVHSRLRRRLRRTEMKSDGRGLERNLFGW